MSDILVPFPLGCWQAFPLGEEEPERMKAIREVALLWNFTDVRSAEAHCKSRGENLAKHCTSLFRAKRVPIIHNMKTPALLQLAIDVLLPLSLGSTELTLQDVPDALESKTKLPERCSPTMSSICLSPKFCCHAAPSRTGAVSSSSTASAGPLQKATAQQCQSLALSQFRSSCEDTVGA